MENKAEKTSKRTRAQVLGEAILYFTVIPNIYKSPDPEEYTKDFLQTLKEYKPQFNKQVEGPYPKTNRLLDEIDIKNTNIYENPEVLGRYIIEIANLQYNAKTSGNLLKVIFDHFGEKDIDE